MARPLRINLSGGWYHVTSRGNERREIFRDDSDRLHCLELLAAMTFSYRLWLHTYVLMENHYHLLVETPEANLSRAMQWLNVSYSQWFNRRHQRSGHLFQGRFQAILVNQQQWGLELSRYVHLNPIRVQKHGLDKKARQRNQAGVGAVASAGSIGQRISQLRSYGWSSYRAYIGLESKPQWLQCQEVLSWMGGVQKDRQRAYQQYVEQAVREGSMGSPWEGLEAQIVLGSEEFVRSLEDLVQGDSREQTALRFLKTRPSFSKVIAVVEELKGERWEAFVNRYGDWGRDLALYLGRRHCGLKLKELGALASGIDYTSVGAAIQRFGQRALKDRKLAILIEKAARKLQNAEM